MKMEGAGRGSLLAPAPGRVSAAGRNIPELTARRREPATGDTWVKLGDAAARAVERRLRAARFDWHNLAEIISTPRELPGPEWSDHSDWRAMLHACRAHAAV